MRSALAAGARTAAEVVAAVYADVDRRVWPAAEQSVRAQLDYLASNSEDSELDAQVAAQRSRGTFEA